MLILTRRIGDVIRIGVDIFVTVLGIRGNQIRLGIAAPRSVDVNREEIHERIWSGRGDGNARPHKSLTRNRWDELRCMRLAERSLES